MTRLTKAEKKRLKRTTTKKERQEMKEKSKEAKIKTREERLAEVTDLKERLLQWEMDQRFDAIRHLYQEMDDYVQSGEVKKGRIPFPGNLYRLIFFYWILTEAFRVPAAAARPRCGILFSSHSRQQMCM